MKLHYKGKYNLDPDSLPHGKHQPGAVPFKEAQDTKTMGIIINVLCMILIIVLAVPAFFRCWKQIDGFELWLGCMVSLLTLFPHEFLHAVCFKEDVYLYTNLKQGMFFVVGPETMSKGRFIWMSLLPNLVFGALPYIIGMVFPGQSFFLSLGILCIGMGAGDYYNVFHALTQMPKGAREYLYKFNSFWYMPDNKKQG